MTITRNDLIGGVIGLAAVALVLFGVKVLFLDQYNLNNCTSELCVLSTKAHLAKDTGVNVDAAGNISVAPRTITTITQAPPVVVSPAPVIVAPRTHTGVAGPGVNGRCPLGADPENGIVAGQLGYTWTTDKRCHLGPQQTSL